jgi:hypothetical protein
MENNYIALFISKKPSRGNTKKNIHDSDILVHFRQKNIPVEEWPQIMIEMRKLTQQDVALV